MSESEFKRMEIQFPKMFKAIRDRALDDAIDAVKSIKASDDIGSKEGLMQMFGVGFAINEIRALKVRNNE